MKVTEKGQVTIPQPVREALGIGQGSEVEFEVKGDHAVLRRVSAPEQVAERLARYRGSADAGLGTDAILALTRS